MAYTSSYQKYLCFHHTKELICTSRLSGNALHISYVRYMHILVHMVIIRFLFKLYYF